MKSLATLVKAGVLGLSLVAASLFVVGPAVSAQALITVTPFENLSTITPTTVTVSGTGLESNASLTIRQEEQNRVPTGVQTERLHKAAVTTDANGAFSVQISVQYDVRTDLAFADFCDNSVELGRLCYLHLQYQPEEGVGEVIAQPKLYFGVSAPAPVDTTEPTISIVTPADEAVYYQNEVVNAEYACNDETSLATCEGNVPNGSPVDTSEPGTYEFTVAATDTAGNTASVTHVYTVEEAETPPPTTPATKDDCKNGGWQNYVDNNGQPFKSQGDCIKSVQDQNGGHEHHSPFAYLLLLIKKIALCFR